ncbi:MAG: glycosyltransferase involved in cell wall biosynthesis [Alteromonadaceae bacterium]
MKIDNKIKVLQLITGLGVGGAERVVVELASELSKNNLNVDVLGLNSNNSILQQYANINFRIDSLQLKKNPLSFIHTLLYLNKFIKKNSITIIHAHMFHALIFALLTKLFKPKLKIVFTSHSFFGFNQLRSFIIRYTKKARHLDIVFDINQHPHLNAKQTVVINNAVHIPYLKKSLITNNKKAVTTLLFLGRLEPPKNPVELIHIFAKIKNKNCHLLIAGDGYLKGDVESAIKKLSLQNRVTLLGIVTDISSLMLKVDCLVLPSLWEGLPMAVLEAGSYALPIISTSVGAIPRLLSDDCGYLSTLAQFPETLDLILNDLALANKRGNNLYNKIKLEYSLSSISKQHFDIYQSISNEITQ